jgi:hypothetical protein
MGKRKNNQARLVKFFLVFLAMFLALIIANKYTQNQSELKNAPMLEHNQSK